MYLHVIVTRTPWNNLDIIVISGRPQYRIWNITIAMVRGDGNICLDFSQTGIICF